MSLNKNLVSLLCSAFLLSGCIATTIEGFDNRATLGNSDKYTAFVGEKIQVVEFDPAEDDPEPSDDSEDGVIIHMDSGFKARYRILELVHGEYDGEIIDFKAYDHYGFPHFAKRKIAMLYLAEYEGALYHVKYQYDVVHPTADGRYAFCGNPYLYLDEDDEIDPRPLHDISFWPPVVLQVSDYLMDEKYREYYSDDEISKHNAKIYGFFSAPDFEVEGDRAVCRRGVYPDELYRIKNESVLLPRQREIICERNLWSEDYHPQNVNEAIAIREKIRACVAQMKKDNLP